MDANEGLTDRPFARFGRKFDKCFELFLACSCVRDVLCPYF
jgi:hypothetical protein